MNGASFVLETTRNDLNFFEICTMFSWYLNEEIFPFLTWIWDMSFEGTIRTKAGQK
jgi:hypothetical protein